MSDEIDRLRADASEVNAARNFLRSQRRLLAEIAELTALRAYMAEHAPMELRAFDVREK